MKSAFFALVLLLPTLGFTASNASASMMIDIGAGSETAQGDVGPNFLFEVRVVAGNKISQIRVSAEVAISPSGDGSAIPYFDIRFTPLALGSSGTEGHEYHGNGYDFLPMKLSRDIRIGHEVEAQIHLVGLRLFRPIIGEREDAFQVFAHVAVAALGYKLVSYGATHDGAFHGFSMGELTAALGAKVGLGDAVLTVLGGATADANFGWFASEVPAFQSEGAVFAELRLRLFELVELFARGSYGYLQEPYGDDLDFRPHAQVLGGLALRFR